MPYCFVKKNRQAGLKSFNSSYHLVNFENNFSFTIEFDDCVESEAAGMTVDLIEKHNVDVIIGPTMNQRK